MSAMWRGMVVCALALWSALAWSAPAGPASAPASAAVMSVHPVDAVDMARLQGKWYEIARYPNFFERRCARSITDDLKLLPSGQMHIISLCKKSDGSSDSTSGVARPAAATPNVARFEASFAPPWLNWVPWLWNDFWVVALDSDYHYVAIADPSRDHLWILSRTAQLDDDSYHQVVAQLRAQNFDIDKLVLTPQP
ncbi:MAG: lipocalin family protein [Burkholderiales bacterium]|nr:lipocalin family protein [Burkholderiales bacterium]